MIKINLLGVAPPPVKMSATGGPPAQAGTQLVMFLVAMIICFGTVGIIYKVWSNQIADYVKQRSKEKIRASELAAVKAQNQKYQAYLRDLETRINTIQALQSSRVGPVDLMNALGNVVSRTNDLYLFSMGSSGDRIQLKGQSGSVNTMSSFLADLKKSGTFDDVTLDQFYQDDVKDHLTYKFIVSCVSKAGAAGTPPAAGGTAGGRGGLAGPGKASSSPPTGMVGAPAQVQQRLRQGL